MNQLRIVSKQEELNKNAKIIELDDERNVVLDIDANYLVSMGLEHIKYKVSETKIKAPKRRLREMEDTIIDILCENGDRILSYTIGSLKSDNFQEILDVLNKIEIESYVLALIIKESTDKVMNLLKEEKLN